MKICKILILITIMNCFGVTQNNHCLKEFSYLYKIDTIILNNPKAETFIEKYKSFSIAVLYKDSLLVNIYSGLGNDTLYYVKDLRTDSVTILSDKNKMIGNYLDSIDNKNSTKIKIKCDPLHIDNCLCDCYKLIINKKMLDSITAYVNLNVSKKCDIFLKQKELNIFDGDIYKFTLHNSLLNVTYIRNKLSDEKVFQMTSKLKSFQKINK